MNATRPIAVGLAVLAVALAGCTGGFTVNQTEPIRVQIEGAPQTVVVREGESKEVNVDTCPQDDDPCDAENVDVRLQVHKVSSEACQVKVIIKTTSGEVLDEVIIDVGGDATGSASATATGDTNTTGNGTGNVTATATQTGSGSSGDTVVQNLVVNVKGNKNIIVVTQALQGSAEVNVQTAKASGHSTVDQDQDDSDDMTTTTAPTNSTTNTTTGYP